MRLEVFEADGYTLPTDIDVLIINLKRKFAEEFSVRKIMISQKDEVRKHKDVVQLLSKQGLDVLPVVKVDGKIVPAEKLEFLLNKKLR
jgi:disulfide oxidoreductase YuzD